MRRHAPTSRGRARERDFDWDALNERRPGPRPAFESPRDSARPARSRHARTRGGVGFRWTPVLLTIAIVLAAGAGIAWIAARGRANPAAAVTRASIASVWGAVTTTTAAAEPATPAAEPTPTPYFASFRGTKLHLPVDPASVTVLAFHQSSYNDSYKLTPIVRIGDASTAKAAATAAKAKGAKVLATPPGEPDADADDVWTGSALELWRTGRAGKSCTAVDCGAHWGTPVVSPLDGTVMRIRPYRLYGKYTDYEIQIKPDAFSDVDVFILHVTDPLVAEGQHVSGGLTEIAKVRHLSGIVSGLQLRSYSTDGGNHTHVQLNVIPHPGQTWVVGQDPPGLVRHGD